MTPEEKRAQRNHEARGDLPGAEATQPRRLAALLKLARRVLRRRDPSDTPPESNR